MSSKRNSLLPPFAAFAPKPPVNFSTTLTVSDAILTGTHSITIQSETVVHPRARIDSAVGGVLIGRRCIIQERSYLGGRVGVKTGVAPSLPRAGRGAADKDEDAGGPSSGARGAVTLGDYVTIEVGAVVEGGGTAIGEGTVVGVGARVGAGATVGKHCRITAVSVIAAGETIPDFTVVYANGLRRLDRRGVTELDAKAQQRLLEVQRKLVANKAEKFL